MVLLDRDMSLTSKDGLFFVGMFIRWHCLVVTFITVVFEYGFDELKQLAK